MSGLAHYLHTLGFFVQGSDVQANEQTAQLEKEGVRIFIGHKASNLNGAEIVVVSSAISDKNPELMEAKKRNLPVVGRAELLSLVASEFENVIGIAGCHGKTTATAMCAHVMRECSGNASAHIGGDDFEFHNFYAGGNKFFITEACEFQGNFLKLKPDFAVILNTDADHLEYYKNEENLLRAYEEFASSAGGCAVCSEDRIAKKIPRAMTFGMGKNSDVSAENIRSNGGKYSFSLRIQGEIFDRIRLNVYGRHNIYNALAAASVACYYHYPSAFIAEGLQKFRGIRRRFEFLGKLCGADIIADYAHHPRELAAVLRTAGEMDKGKLFVVFQPHTYSRTKLLFEDFVRVLKDIENLVIYKTYPAREYFDAEGSALTLAESLPKSLYIESLRELGIYLRCSLTPEDRVLFLGAGDIYYVAKQLLQKRKI